MTRYLHDSHMKVTSAKPGVQNLSIILGFPLWGQALLRGNDNRAILQSVLKNDSIMAKNIKDLYLTAETQRSQRIHFRKTSRKTTTGFTETFQGIVQHATFCADCFICRHLPANKRFFSLRPLRLCGDHLLPFTHEAVSMSCCGTEKAGQERI